MILRIKEHSGVKFLAAEVALGFDDSLKFEVIFPLSDVKKLIEEKKSHLFEISESEDAASAIQDWREWGEDL